jgi:hypothetical protein
MSKKKQSQQEGNEFSSRKRKAKLEGEKDLGRISEMVICLSYGFRE